MVFISMNVVINIKQIHKLDRSKLGSIALIVFLAYHSSSCRLLPGDDVGL